MATGHTNCADIDLRLRQLLGDERKTQVEFLFAFGEYEHRRGYAELGYATVWDYAERELKLLTGSVFRRVHSARILRMAPQAAKYLLDGRMSTTTLAALRDVISVENADEYLERCSGKSKSDVEYIVRCAQAKVVSVKEVLRKVPARPVKPPSPADPAPSPKPDDSKASGSLFSSEKSTEGFATSDVPVDSSTSSPDQTDEEIVEERTVQMPPRRVEIVEALSAEQFLLKVLVGKDFVEMLGKLRKKVSHRVPSGSIAEVLEDAVATALTLEEKKHAPKPASSTPAKKVAKQTSKTNEPSTAASSKNATVFSAECTQFVMKEHKRTAVPIATLRQLWEEEGGICTAPLANGGVCGSEWQLQTEHKIPVACGGSNDRSNLCLRCRAHNILAARDVFGDVMNRFIRKK